MAENPKQPKPRRNSSGTKIQINSKKRWQDLVNGVDKKEVPVSILERIVVNLIDGTVVSVNVKELLGEGQQDSEIEEMLNNKFSDLDPYIKNVDFFVDIEKVVKTVQPETDKVLKGI